NLRPGAQMKTVGLPLDVFLRSWPACRRRPDRPSKRCARSIIEVHFLEDESQHIHVSPLHLLIAWICSSFFLQRDFHLRAVIDHDQKIIAGCVLFFALSSLELDAFLVMVNLDYLAFDRRWFLFLIFVIGQKTAGAYHQRDQESTKPVEHETGPP